MRQVDAQKAHTGLGQAPDHVVVERRRPKCAPDLSHRHRRTSQSRHDLLTQPGAIAAKCAEAYQLPRDLNRPEFARLAPEHIGKSEGDTAAIERDNDPHFLGRSAVVSEVCVDCSRSNSLHADVCASSTRSSRLARAGTARAGTERGTGEIATKIR
jgi:hypothetical protein